MRIAHLIDLLNWGGAQKLEVTFAQVARDRQIDFTVISLRHDEHTPIPDELAQSGAHVITFPARSLFDPLRIIRLVRFLRRERFDILHTHLTYANILGALAGKLASVPVVATLHSTGFDARHDHPIKRRLEAFALRYGARRIIAVGQTVADAHRARLGGRVLDVIPNAVAISPALAPEHRIALRAQLIDDPSKKILIAVGRFSPPKGYADLIAAFDLVHRAHPDTALVIVGDGALRDEISARIAAHQLQADVHLLGARNDVPALLAASDVYVLSSHYEGLPLTLLEAMSAGLPCVVTNVGEIPRVAIEGTARLVPPHDPATLASAIDQLLAQPTQMRAMGDAARTHIACHYAATVWLDRLLTVYAQAGSSNDQQMLEHTSQLFEKTR